MHSVTTPEKCIFALGFVVTESSRFKPYCVHGGTPIRILLRDMKLDYDHYMIDDYSK